MVIGALPLAMTFQQLRAHVLRRQRNTRGGWPARVRLCVSIAVAVLIAARPARLSSERWWWSPDVVQSIGLTEMQREAIERIYQRQRAGRSRCIERGVEATNRVTQLIRDGVFDETILEQTQAIASAAAEERSLTHLLNEDIASVLSPELWLHLTMMRGDLGLD